MAEMIVFYSFLSFLAIYGFVSITVYIRNLFADIGIMKGKTVFTIVALKNEEDKAEGIIKSLLLKANASDSGISDNRIIAVDLGSSDKTAEIIRKMEADNTGVNLLTPEELPEYIKGSVV